ncbi:MAG TPA: glycoside hydrolase family 3 N-terminal domain-containing protein [Anaerolineaceae bacterium]
MINLDGMNLDQKIGQVMVIGFDGVEISPELEEMIHRYHIGGIVYFARNVQSPGQLGELTNQLQIRATAAGLPGLWISIDQEGGRVARLTEKQGFTEIPGAMAIGATGSLDTAREATEILGMELKVLGINMDYAPCVDVNINPANPVIGIRSYGSDPQQVGVFGEKIIHTLQGLGVAAVAKHFPGHGDTGVDSHTSLPSIEHDLKQVEMFDLPPFQVGALAGVAGVMIGHLTFPGINQPDGLPATLSTQIYDNLLRKRLAYKGLAITDCLDMGALTTSGFSTPLAAAMALQAGADVLLFNRDHEVHRAAFQLIRDWVMDGKIPPSRLEEAVRRNLSAKALFGVLEPKLTDPIEIRRIVGSEMHRDASRRMAGQAITVVKNKGNLLPLCRSERVLVIEHPAAEGLGKMIGAETLKISDKPARNENNFALSAAADGKVVIVTTADANRIPQQAELVRNLVSEQVPLIVIAVRNPYDLLAFPEVQTYIVTYGSNPPTMDALAAVLTGKMTAQGKLPVDISL